MKKIEKFNEFNRMIKTTEEKQLEDNKNAHIIYHELSNKDHVLSKYEIKEKLKEVNDTTNWFG
jgi:hypothetical protein